MEVRDLTKIQLVMVSLEVVQIAILVGKSYRMRRSSALLKGLSRKPLQILLCILIRWTSIAMVLGDMQLLRTLIEILGYQYGAMQLWFSLMQNLLHHSYPPSLYSSLAVSPTQSHHLPILLTFMPHHTHHHSYLHLSIPIKLISLTTFHHLFHHSPYTCLFSIFPRK